ncbi:MAG: hypothetical protein KDA75_16460 [Planctomycetaceae bacterium]|nr:hypothetical protein [Planctomycetaceae bacterium]
MSDSPDTQTPTDPTDPLAAHAPPPGLLADYLDFLRTNKKWWLTPIILALLLVGLLVFLSVSGVGPAIYPFF